jgi:hypothetical protein
MSSGEIIVLLSQILIKALVPASTEPARRALTQLGERA